MQEFKKKFKSKELKKKFLTNRKYNLFDVYIEK